MKNCCSDLPNIINNDCSIHEQINIDYNLWFIGRYKEKDNKKYLESLDGKNVFYISGVKFKLDKRCKYKVTLETGKLKVERC
jgi:hypothetical protein